MHQNGAANAQFEELLLANYDISEQMEVNEPLVRFVGE